MDGFAKAGYGVGDVGWGKRPAIVVVDFQLAFTAADLPIGGSSHIDAAVERTVPVLEAARAARVPVIHTYVAWGSPLEFGRWKIPSLAAITPPSRAARIDPRVWAGSDLLLLKRYPSAFFGTDLAALLTRNEVDTVLVMGATTSGCVRATVIDSFSHGFRTQVVADCCGDQSVDSHEANLLDVGRRYADVIDADAALTHLAGPFATVPD